MVTLVLAQGDSPRAEQGTGRVIAPYVRRHQPGHNPWRVRPAAVGASDWSAVTTKLSVSIGKLGWSAICCGESPSVEPDIDLVATRDAHPSVLWSPVVQLW